MRRKGWLYLAIALGVLFLAGAGVAALKLPRKLAERRLAQVRADWRALSIACATYGIDNCGLNFPADTSLRRQVDPTTPQTFEYDTQFLLKALGNRGASLLTTPVSYMKSIPGDPFRADGAYYGYAAINAINRPGTITPLAFLHSPGPDGRTDLDPAWLREQIDKLRPVGKSWHLNPDDRIAIRKLVDPLLYDPSNGTRSGGDLVLIMDTHYYHYGFAWEKNSKEWDKELRDYQTAGTDEVQSDKPLEQPIDTAYVRADDRYLRVEVPYGLFAAWSQAGLLQPTPGLAELNPARLDQLRGHFGPFLDFFKAPRPLTPAEIESFDKWRSEDPVWWAAMDGVETYSKKPHAVMSVYDFYPLMAIYGKSRLLLAARVLETAPDKSRLHVSAVKLFLHQVHLGRYTSREMNYKTPYMERVHFELGRLGDGMMWRIIERLGVPQSSEKKMADRQTTVGQ